MQIKIEKGYRNGHSVFVNGVCIGEEYSGGEKYKDPEKWAKKQLKKRLAVIDRNIKRLLREMREWTDEKKQLTYETT